MKTQVSKHFVTFRNFPCPIPYLLCCLLMLFLCFLPVVWLGISVEVDEDRITILLPPSSLTSYCILSLPTFLSLIQVTVMHQSIPAVPIPPSRATAGHLLTLSVPGVGHWQFYCGPQGLGQPPGI